MRNTIFIFILLLILFRVSYAQNDSIKSIELLKEISIGQKDSLLPGKYLFTQHLLWGKKGLMRNFNRFELTPEKRQNELKLRRAMLVTHQVIGTITLGGMIAQGIVGYKLYNGNDKLLSTHEALASGINIGYFTTAFMSLFAPPKMLNERKGYGSIKAHKILAIVHFSGMIATNIIAGQLEAHDNLRPYHRAAALTAFGAYAASMIVIMF